MQPFLPAAGRPWEEVMLSSLLCLKVAEMVERGVRFADFRFSVEKARLSGVFPTA